MQDIILTIFLSGLGSVSRAPAPELGFEIHGQNGAFPRSLEFETSQQEAAWSS
jgi:hypothetical protein